MKYFFDNINTAEIENICAAGDAPEMRVPCRACGGSGVIESGTGSNPIYMQRKNHLHICGKCGAELDIVRPGKYQCPNCD